MYRHRLAWLHFENKVLVCYCSIKLSKTVDLTSVTNPSPPSIPKLYAVSIGTTIEKQIISKLFKILMGTTGLYNVRQHPEITE